MMERELKTTYLRLVAPAVLVLAVLLGARSAGVEFALGLSGRYTGPVIFILAGTFGLALPIFYRTLFLHRIRHRKRTSAADLIAFERRFLLIALIPAYLAALGYALNIANFHFSGTVLIALYAAYYYYPSPKRIELEKRIFRVEQE